MKAHAYSADSSSSEEMESFYKTGFQFTSTEDIEQYFNHLSEITDRVAMINSDYQTDLEAAVSDLESFFPDSDALHQLYEMDEAFVPAFLSHMSFHREIIADIIEQARQLLVEERRKYLRRLVSYHKSFVKDFTVLERKFQSR
ncbi:MAG: PLU-1-like domain protein [Spirochaetia bacterium]|nr:PLU-1-like domain protein [Spirochaetia bacterium]